VLHHPDTQPFARELLAELYTERGFAAFVIAYDADRFHLILASGKHHGEVNLIPVLDRLDKLVGIGALEIQVDFNDIGEFSILAKNGRLHCRIFLYQVLQAFSHGLPVQFYDFLTVRELPEGQMKMYFDSHLFYLLTPSSRVCGLTP
jgi:hypothetical protein